MTLWFDGIPPGDSNWKIVPTDSVNTANSKFEKK